MKKIIALLLGLVCVVSLAACSSGNNDKTDKMDKEIEEALGTLKDIINNATSNSNDNNTNENVTNDNNTNDNNTNDSYNDLSDIFNWGNTDNKKEEAVDPKTVDFSKIDVELPDDGSMMKQFMSDTQSGKYNNKVIKVKGIMSTRITDPSTNTVLQKVGDGVKLGFDWRIVEANESTEYPAEDSIIELVGVMIAEYNETWGMDGHYLYVLPENVKDLGYPED